MGGRKALWTSVVVAVAGVVGLSAYLAVAGLNKASALAAVVTACVELVALVIGIYSVASSRNKAGGNHVDQTSIRGDLTQVHAVEGGVRIHRRDVRWIPRGPRSASKAKRPAPGGTQSVTNSQIDGHVDQIDDVGDSVELD
jgi:uncharacterized protein (TIGR02588 family)